VPEKTSRHWATGKKLKFIRDSRKHGPRDQPGYERKGTAMEKTEVYDAREVYDGD
jgi:hypothetical protein